jgi:hypothetical protein
MYYLCQHFDVVMLMNLREFTRNQLFLILCTPLRYIFYFHILFDYDVMILYYDDNSV